MSHDHDHGRGRLGATPVLDIGEDVGAMVVHLESDTPTGELEACPHGDPDARFHTGVHHLAAGWVAVYPEVRAGRYDLLAAGGHVVATVDVDGGRVTQLSLR